MDDQTDQQLLRDYAQARSESAFAELVRRHVDLVYSAALRMVQDSHLAQDVAQGAFMALARNAAQLADHAVLSGWLHRTAQNLAVKVVRTDARRKNREHQTATMNELLADGPDASWEEIAPHLDAVLGELSESDRDAVMLRYFERKSAREMARILDISEEAAQKRVGRAVERLRELLGRRAVTVGAGTLAVVIAAHAVQAAPPGLALALSTAVMAGAGLAITGTTVAVSAAGKSIVTMTTLKIGLVGATVAAAAMAAPLAMQHQTQLSLRVENQTLREQVAQLTQSPPQPAAPEAALAAAPTERVVSEDQFRELLRLRGEVGRLREGELAQVKARESQRANDPIVAENESLLARANRLRQELDARPKLKIPELRFLTGRDWLEAAMSAKFDTDSDLREALDLLRHQAKEELAPKWRAAVKAYTDANGGRFPENMAELKPYLDGSMDDAILDRYWFTTADNGKVWAISERGVVDSDYDTLISVQEHGFSTSRSKSFAARYGNQGGVSFQNNLVRIGGDTTNNDGVKAGRGPSQP